MWECSKCHEQVEDNFEVCWNCGTAVDGTEDPEFTRSDVHPAKPETEDGDIVMAEPNEPPIEAPLVCAKCGSRDVIPNARIIDRGGGGSRFDLEAEVYENPKAILFWGTHVGTLNAWICGRCGHVDLYVSNPSELLAAYRKSKASGAE